MMINPYGEGAPPAVVPGGSAGSTSSRPTECSGTDHGPRAGWYRRSTSPHDAATSSSPSWHGAPARSLASPRMISNTGDQAARRTRDPSSPAGGWSPHHGPTRESSNSAHPKSARGFRDSHGSDRTSYPTRCPGTSRLRATRGSRARPPDAGRAPPQHPRDPAASHQMTEQRNGHDRRPRLCSTDRVDGPRVSATLPHRRREHRTCRPSMHARRHHDSPERDRWVLLVSWRPERRSPFNGDRRLNRLSRRCGQTPHGGYPIEVAPVRLPCPVSR